MSRPSAAASRSASSTRPTKRARGAPQGELGVGVEPPSDIDAGEEKVAELVGAALVRAAGELLFQLGELVLEIGERTVDVRVLEADRGGAALHLAGVEKRRQRLGHVVEDAFAPLLLALDPLPVLAYAPGGLRLDVTEYVRVTAHELLVDGAGDLFEATLTLL